MRLVKKMSSVITAILIALTTTVICTAYDGAPPKSTDIVYIVDTSGSMDNTDKEKYVKDALRLGVDLAPENSRIAVVALNAEVVSEAELTDTSEKEGKNYLKGYVDQLQNKGNTNFSTGLERAATMLEASAAQQKRIIFLGDFSEGGYNAGGKESEAISAVEEISARAKDNGIVIDMLLWGEAPPSSGMATKILELPHTTGGRLVELSDPKTLPSLVENIYFQNFEYHYTAIGVRGEGAQAINMPMPTKNVRRARIYVSAQSPASAFGASYSGATLDGEQNRSYSIIELQNPSLDGVNLSLTAGESGGATLYLLLEYDPLDISVSTESELVLPEGAKKEIQNSTIYAEVVDSKTGTPLLTAPYSDNVNYKVEISSPTGQISTPYDSSDPTRYSFSPDFSEDFGEYQITAELTVGDIVFGPFAKTVTIPDIRPVEEPTNWPLIIAVGVGAVLILTALVIASRRVKKEAEFQGAIEMSSDYRFHGKLYICAVMVDGGNEEIRPYDFMLYKLQKEKRITLQEILASGRALHHFPGAENILILVGPEESIIIRNNTDVTMRVMGKEYGPRSKVQLFYGQKVYIIFQKDENELEIYYRKTKDESMPNINFSTASKSH